MKPKEKSNYEAEDLYLKLLGRPDKNVDDILFLKNLDEYKKEIYTQPKMLFDVRERIFEKLVNKKITETDSNQSSIDNYEENFTEKTKLRRQELAMIKNKEQNINNYFFKEYFINYQSPSNMYNRLSDAKKTEEHNI